MTRDYGDVGSTGHVGATGDIGVSLPPFNRTLGKTVCLNLGAVVTDMGPSAANGVTDEGLRRCVTDDGVEYVILRTVVENLPAVVRRSSFTYRPGDSA